MPTVTKVVLGECSARTQRQQLIQAAILLRPVVRFFTLLPRKPLQDLRKVAVNRLRRHERAACYRPEQVRDLPAKCRLQDPMYMAQSQGAPEP